MRQNGFQIEHCRPNCPRSACDWHNLLTMLTQKLTELNLQQALTAKFDSVQFHHLPKISLAGCPNGCSLPDIKDFGVSGYVVPQITDIPCSGCEACARACLEAAISKKSQGIVLNTARCISCGDCLRVCPTGTLSAGERGWTIRYGGRVGRHPQFAKVAGQVLTDEEAVSWICAALQCYLEQGQPQERLTHFLNSLELSRVKSESGQNARESRGAIF
ncbi:4Fe-4S dicluster domain-containing protein [Desulfosporosinus sp. PR]|uniref:4Fe-4S dicluster domain-containing protein n=1 Tax=Candidatus Desulfosporosinus nitrosoreducens TaxID=3401928 RepID=UPI0027FE4A4F|nr:4Fe-4S dicluster domain-containing protein [Desulfosporosinus sp. PR]MDQ7092697.1 4Fe-4S dicluster domain-containing protein [Desulfosporosinus sp. PR]